MKHLVTVWPWIFLLLQSWIRGIIFGHKISENSRIQLDTSQVEFRNLKNTRKLIYFFHSKSLTKVQKQLQFVFMSEHNSNFQMPFFTLKTKTTCFIFHNFHGQIACPNANKLCLDSGHIDPRVPGFWLPFLLWIPWNSSGPFFLMNHSCLWYVLRSLVCLHTMLLPMNKVI